jgi:hypothetical protein
VTQDQVIILALKVVLVAGIVAVALFVAVYSYLAPWRNDPVGRTVVQVEILVALALVPTTLSLFLEFSRFTSHVAAWCDITIFGLIAIGVLQRIPLWVRLHLDREGHRSYAGMLPFLAEVIKRRGRPVWKDRVPRDDAEDAVER